MGYRADCPTGGGAARVSKIVGRIIEAYGFDLTTLATGTAPHVAKRVKRMTKKLLI
jgi:hypothetical protein